MSEKIAELIAEIKEKVQELEMIAMNKEMPEYEMEDEEEMPEMDMKKAAFIAKMKKEME